MEVGKLKYTYKGAESGVVASDTFVLVINPERKNIVISPKKYNPFIKTMRPNNMLIVPLAVDDGKRIYDELSQAFDKDCLSDVSFLQSRAGMEAITMLHVEGIRKYCEHYDDKDIYTL